MAANQDQTVWFPKDSLLYVLVSVPLCGFVGLVWAASWHLSWVIR